MSRLQPVGLEHEFARQGLRVISPDRPGGQAEIGATLRGIFADHQTAAYVARVREVRTLGPGVTLLRAVVGMIPPGQRELNPAANAVQSLVVITGPGEPRIALLHNTPAAFHGRPHLGQQLTDELAAVVRHGQVVADAD